MKKIYDIAKAELQSLFYSPVAWLIIIIFTFQLSMSFTSGVVAWVKYNAQGYTMPGATMDLLANRGYGLFMKVLQYLYLYIPLLTMGLMSRELASGSINLLYSSPVRNSQIILGKFLSMMIYGLILIAILMVFVLFTWFTVKDCEIALSLSGLLGIYLLICAYAAIGLFMSSLTSYQVVVAIGTLGTLAALNYVGNLWQSIAFVRDITYWFSMSGRSTMFVYGLIGSEDVLYFIIVVALFLSLTIIRLQANRQKSRWTVSISKYLTVICLAMLLGYITSRPAFKKYCDTTTDKANTLTPNSQEVIKKLKGGLTITTYVNAFDNGNLGLAIPSSLNYDKDRFMQYLRFKPEIKLKYVYYYDDLNNPDFYKLYPNMTSEERLVKLCEVWDLNPKMFLTPEQIKKQIDLSAEGNKFVRLIERESGEKTFLRIFSDMQKHPGEREITAAFKRVAMKLPVIGFMTGHGERNSTDPDNYNYNTFAAVKSFRYALLNQGFDVVDVSLDKELPAEVNIVIIADLKTAMTDAEKVNMDKYIARGGNLLLAVEPKRSEFMAPLFEQMGVSIVPGTLVARQEEVANLTVSRPTQECADLMYAFEEVKKYKYVITMPSAAGLEYTTDKGFHAVPLLVSDSLAWNELETTNFLDDTVSVNPAKGEIQKPYVTALALSREIGGRQQKIIVLGDADCLSSGELGTSRRGLYASNYSVVTGGFYWLSDNEVPIDVRRPKTTDDLLTFSKDHLGIFDVMYQWVFPGAMLLIAILMWIRRRGR